MGALHGQEGRLEKGVPFWAQYGGIGQCQEFFIPIEFILDALIPVDMHATADQVRGGLNGGIYGDLGNDICEDLAFFIIFNGHIASLECGWFQGMQPP